MATAIKIKCCPACGGDKIRLVHRNWRGKFQGHAYTVSALEYYECPDCDEKIYDREAMKRIEDCSPAFPSRKPSKKSA
jgi:YgiT-type zinc finger domain-containing protein